VCGLSLHEVRDDGLQRSAWSLWGQTRAWFGRKGLVGWADPLPTSHHELTTGIGKGARPANTKRNYLICDRIILSWIVENPSQINVRDDLPWWNGHH
jgi:hypothetical protein